MTLNQYETGTTIRLSVEFKDQNSQLYDPTTVTAYMIRPSGTIDTISTIVNESVGKYYFDYTVPDEEGDYTYQFRGSTPSAGTSETISYFFSAISYNSSVLDYLIPALRVHLGDNETLTYSVDTLRQCLILAIKALSSRWRDRYIFTSVGALSRNTTYQTFSQAEPPVIETRDEYPIILQAAIILKSSELKQTSTSISSTSFIGSWRDDEISVSNIQSGQIKENSLIRDLQELNYILPPRGNKLAHARKQSLLGFNNPPNVYEG